MVRFFRHSTSQLLVARRTLVMKALSPVARHPIPDQRKRHAAVGDGELSATMWKADGFGLLAELREKLYVDANSIDDSARTGTRV